MIFNRERSTKNFRDSLAPKGRRDQYYRSVKMASVYNKEGREGFVLLLLILTVFCYTFTCGTCHSEQGGGNETVNSQLPCGSVTTTVDVYPTTPKHEEMNSVASVYVRWGRSDCREGAELVYSGITAGASAFQKGGGGNFLCMPNRPLYATTEAAPNNDRAKLRATGLFGNLFPPFQPLYDSREDITCAVCRAPRRSTVLMVPGRNLCPTEAWTLEYQGYLAAPRITLERAEFICVDSSPEGYPGTAGHPAGHAELHPVESECEGLPCEPYFANHELTCAVCTL